VSQKSKNRLTKNGKRKGRPPRYLAPWQIDDPRPASSQFTKEPATAKPSPVAGSDTLWIIRALRGEGKRGYARALRQELLEAGAGDRELESVKRRLARVRHEVRNSEGIDWLPDAGPNKPKK
jgi:hypothetical protein